MSDCPLAVEKKAINNDDNYQAIPAPKPKEKLEEKSKDKKDKKDKKEKKSKKKQK